jgi:two-component system, OmpR family, sensor histidine kinase VicK
MFNNASIDYTMTIPLPFNDLIEKMEVFYGTEKVISEELLFFSKSREYIDTCMDSTRPSFVIGIESIKRSFIHARNRGVKLRYLTEITDANISYCKELMSIVDEVRHLDGIKGNFMVSEIEYLAPATSHEEAKLAALIIYSSIKEIVEHQQYMFETLWNKSMSAERRIKELEDGITTHYQTKVIEDPVEVVREIGHQVANSNEICACLSSGGMQYSYNHFFEIRKKLLEKQKKGEHKGVRYISNITQDNEKFIKAFLDAGIKIRHVKNLPPMSFGVSDKEIGATIEKMEGGKMVHSLLLSNEPAYIDHFRSIFEDLWAKGTDAEDRIKEIDEGTDLTDIEIIQNPREGIDRAWEYVKKSKYEVLSIFATPNAFRRQVNMGLLQLLKEATEQRHVQVRILIPGDKQIKDTIDHAAKVCPLVDFRVAEENIQTKITIVLIDKKDCMIVELRDDTKDSSYYAAGLATYSNSKSIITSYASIFESLWKQNQLYEQLKIHDRMQKEFINVAAHELRTPIQPILGLADILRSKQNKTNGGEEAEYLDVIIRNAKRLQRLTEDILDISRIESKSLDLKKESFNLSEMILNAIAESNNQLAKEHKDTNLKLEFIDPKEDIFIEADKNRINQVISNLLSNAIKFTNEGTVSMIAVPDSNEIVVSITDTGPGIDSEILPRLFTKFATKSRTGTGLGLFISKSIIDAHGGKIWGKNNYPEGKGATFGFSLPL